jgi:hypothetical protein
MPIPAADDVNSYNVMKNPMEVVAHILEGQEQERQDVIL